MKENNISEDIWKKKDLLSAKQTSANVTSYIFEGKEIDVDTFLEYAEKIFQYLFQGQNNRQEMSSSLVIPEPTAAQKKIVDEINRQVGKDVRADILNWAEKMVGKRIYPAKSESVDKFIQWYDES